jgi:Cu(I)/Ag(I) efflux system membrane fusion protein
MDLIPIGKGGEGLSTNQIKMSDNAMALADIQTSVVGDGHGSESSTVTLSGKIMENAGDNSVQASYFNGRLEKENFSWNAWKK